MTNLMRINVNLPDQTLSRSILTLCFDLAPIPIGPAGTKGGGFENITREPVENVIKFLSFRLLKTLNFKTPHTVFCSEITEIALRS